MLKFIIKKKNPDGQDEEAYLVPHAWYEFVWDFNEHAYAIAREFDDEAEAKRIANKVGGHVITLD